MKIELDTIQNDLLKTGMKLASAISHIKAPDNRLYQAYLVGGCVRDIVRWKLGQIEFPEIHDIDIATNMPIADAHFCLQVRYFIFINPDIPCSEYTFP